MDNLRTKGFGLEALGLPGATALGNIDSSI